MQDRLDPRAYLAATARRNAAIAAANEQRTSSACAPLLVGIGAPAIGTTCTCGGGGWRCAKCGYKKAEHAGQIILAGLLSTRSNSLVSIGAVGHSLDELQTLWENWRKRLQRLPRGAMPATYAVVLGFDPKTRLLHLHIVFLEAPYVPFGTIARHCRELGLGNPNIRRIGSTSEDARRVSRYLAKNLLTLQCAPPAPGTRLRPFNKSNSWPT